MIDESKIKEAARNHLNAFRKTNPDGYSSCIVDVETDCLDNFTAGAQWAQQEFIKTLWHDASEEPKEHSDIVYIDDKGNVWSEYNYCAENYDDAIYTGWQSFIHNAIIVTKWCYLSDILQKEGGEK